MEWISKSNILIVGLGLMGGSYAKALKRLGYHVCAIVYYYSKHAGYGRPGRLM